MVFEAEQITTVIQSKNFKKFVVWSKGWPNAMNYLSRLLAEIDTGIIYNAPSVKKKLIELKIPAALKRASVKDELINDFFLRFKRWSYDIGVSEPRILTPKRKRGIKLLLRNFTSTDIDKALKNAEDWAWGIKEGVLDIDYFIRTDRFISFLEKGDPSVQGKKHKHGIMGDF